ncbi:glycerol-3-phosphate 1-O-acyltransferase PlsY [Micavibrio aeruginosavorus]|uniref:Glycerol-3-phosphate acyltransferase n=1 Tax=Micavibrio aeruginosavorus EPB TaxID=349215 RepID=M4VJI8_9BACT|nr:glycerol-3-phosphate 1-O-acyltransferase PlsY [Micavibrio aeruginosavorus]AGH98655.1 Acyl-phosphate:glycerol-3-phosphate O-acyltransferase PlsY [Micavibrio aeruginosavorus EPB]
MTSVLLFSVFGYLLGAIPFGLVLARLGGYGDIRKIGSGNIGATNVLRTGNKPLALLTLILDGGKGALAVAIANHFGSFDAAMAAGLFSILGHCFPVWLKFKGGKGVATTLGMVLALAPLTGLAACATWLVVAFISRISSLSALIAMVSMPISAFLVYHDAKLAAVCAGVAAFVWIRHKANIQRILKGEEPKIGKKKKDA